MPEFTVRGIIPALLTPFDVHGDPDLSLLQSEVAYLDQAGVDAVCVGAIAGETAGSTAEEYGRICKAVHDATRKSVIASIYPDSTPEALSLADAALSAGAAALLVAQPHYLFQPDMHGLESLFEELRRRVPVPVLLSNTLKTAPIGLAGMKRLEKAGLIDGVHQGASDAHLLADLLSSSPRCPVVNGVEGLMFVGFLLGAEAALVSMAALFPEDCVEMHGAFRNGEHHRARLIHERLARVWRVLDHPVEFLGRLKFASLAQGRSVGVPRSPYDYMRPEGENEVRRALADMGKR